MVEKVLLGITAVFPKILRRKFLQFPRRQPAPAWKILLAQDPLDPDVDRESAQAFVGKEHADRGYLLELRGQKGQAAEEYSTALRLGPESALVHYNYGMSPPRKAARSSTARR